MKKFVFLFLMFLNAALIYGQAREDTVKKIDIPVQAPSGYIALGGGLAIPIGGYNAKEYEIYPPPGISIGPLVGNGYCFTISAGKPIGKSDFGIAAVAGYYTNGFSINDYVSALNEVDLGHFTAQSATGFKVVSLMAGPSGMFPFNRFSVDIKMLAGVLYVVTPYIQYAGTNVAVAPVPYQGNWFVSSVSLATAALDFGAQGRYTLKKSISVFLGADLLFSGHNRVDFTSNAQPYFLSNLIIVNLVNVTGGIAYKL